MGVRWVRNGVVCLPALRCDEVRGIQRSCAVRPLAFRPRLVWLC
jgi:hypothetical protein